MARQRHVFPTSEVPHLWVNQTQYDARNPQNNLFFEGATIYSYRRSWPLATIHKNKAGDTLVLTNCDRYSTTTAQHQSAVNRACSQFDQIAVPYPDLRAAFDEDAHVKNLAYLAKVQTRLLAEAERAMLEANVDWREEQARRLYASVLQYRKFFKIKGKAPSFSEDNWRVARQRINRICNPDPASADKRERAAARRRESARRVLISKCEAYNARVREHNAAYAAAIGENPVDAWRDHREIPRGEYRPDLYLRWKDRAKFERAGLTVERVLSDGRRLPMALRVSRDGTQIETTQGARIPVDHAPRLWKLIEAVRAAGRPYVRNGHTVHAGPYAVDRIDVDGTLRAGCHVIPYGELEIMARKLNLI